MTKEDVEKYFLKKLSIDTDIDNCYFCMPSNDCFTYCINELMSALKNRIEESINNNYVLELSKWFYYFLEKDTILRSIDSLRFADLMLLLKSISEGKNYNDKEILTALYNIKHALSYNYFNRVITNIISAVDGDLKDADFDYLDHLECLFLNESLARGIDIRFVHKTIEWYQNGSFCSFENFLRFFIDKVRISYDVYIPIKGYDESHKEVFKQNDQEIIFSSNQYYLHIYQNDSIDYYSIITSHMMRVESIFNVLKLYTASEIDYNQQSDILIDISCKRLKGIKSVFLSFKDLINYKGVAPSIRFMNNTIDNLNQLYESDKDIYHKLLDIIGYSEKDNDTINCSSFVDAWIALESLYSLNEIVTGYRAVKDYLALFISSRIIIDKITFLLKNSSLKGKRSRAESFLTSPLEEIEKQISSCTCDYYFKRELIKIKKKTLDLRQLRQYYEEIENRITIDILRIYMLRNEYVHESKLSAFKSLQFYRLKNYLTISIDLFFNMLNQRIRIDKNRKDYSIAYEVFSKIREKNLLRRTLFTITTEKRKYNNNTCVYEIDELKESISLADLVVNIIFNNNSIVSKFVKYDD